MNQQLERWRSQFHASPAFRAEDLEQLEGHLRDAVAELTAKGLSGEEAFWLAERRLGSQEDLAREFRKVGKERTRLTWVAWLLAGWAGILLLKSVVRGGCSLILLLGHALLGARGDALGAVWIGSSLILTLGLCALAWRRFSSIENLGVRIRAWALRKPGAAAGTVVLFAVLGVCLASGPMFLQVRYLALGELQRVALWQNISSLILDLIVPALVTFWVLRGLARLESDRRLAC